MRTFIIMAMAAALVASCTDDGSGHIGGESTPGVDARSYPDTSQMMSPDPAADAMAGTPDSVVAMTPDAMAGMDTQVGVGVPDGTSMMAIDSMGIGEGQPDMTIEPEPQPPTLPRGLTWVRDNPMFISGLTPSMGAPPAWWVDQYYDDFGATAAHTWQVGLPTAVSGWQTGRSDARWLSWVRFDGTSGENNQIIGGSQVPMAGRIGYQIGDEPLDQASWDETIQGVAAVRAADPDALIVINYTYRAEELLDSFLQDHCDQLDADVFSYDQYTRSQGSYEHLERYRSWGLACDKPYWRYMRSYSDPGENNWESESDMRWDAYSGLVYGYTGHTWFLYQISPGHMLDTSLFQQTGAFDATPSERFHYAAEINSGLRNLGRAITQMTSTDVRYISSISFLQPDGTRPFSAHPGGDPYLVDVDPGSFQDALVGLFSDYRGEHAFMVQNPNHSGGTVHVSGTNDVTMDLVFDFSSAPSGVDQGALIELDKVTGLEVEHALSATAAGQATLSVTLAAGDARLFKYKTGSSFLLGS